MAGRNAQTLWGSQDPRCGVLSGVDWHRGLELASTQLGLITTAQAAKLELSDSAVDHGVAIGVWTRRRRGLLALTGMPRSWEQDVMGAVLLAGDLAWASHATAARLGRFAGFEEEARIEITTPLEKRVRQPAIVSHRSGHIEERDVTVVKGVPCMSAARTIVDLSSRFSVERLGHLVDDGLRRGVLTVGGLDRAARRFSRIAPGRSPKTLEAVLRGRIPGYHGTNSNLEQVVFDAIVAGGLPAPVRQFKVVVRGDPYYIDLAYPDHLVAIEADGFDFHRGRAVFDADRARQNDLVNLGWLMLRFTSAFSDEQIVADVRRALFGQFSSL
jgi:very-short-patch-repair endonuclease